MTAVRIRFIQESVLLVLWFTDHELQSSKPSVAALVIDDGFEQVDASKIGPEGFSDVDLAVRALPERKLEIRSSPLVRTSRSSSGKIARVELVGDALFGEFIGTAAFVHQSPDCCARGVDDLSAAAVVQRDSQDHAFVSGGLFGGARDLFANVFRQRADSADGLKLDVLAIDLVEFDPECNDATCASTRQLRNVVASSSLSRTRTTSARPDPVARLCRRRREQPQRRRGGPRCVAGCVARPNGRCRP